MVDGAKLAARYCYYPVMLAIADIVENKHFVARQNKDYNHLRVVRQIPLAGIVLVWQAGQVQVGVLLLAVAAAGEGYTVHMASQHLGWE